MENNTDKPYSLQDAKDEASKEWNRAFDFRSFTNGISVGNIKMLHIYPVIDRAMELYTSKATEELRKENEELRKLLHDHNGMCQQKLNDQIKSMLPVIKRLKESNKQLEEWKRQQMEVTGPIFDWGQSQKDVTVGTSIVREILKRLEEHKALKESNKELVEDLKKAVMYMNLDDPIRIKVLKSEGDVNTLDGKQIMDGDTFDLPEGMGFEEESITTMKNHTCTREVCHLDDNCCGNDKTFETRSIRLLPEKPVQEESQEALWASIINEARWYDGTPQDLRKLTKFFKSKFDTIKRKES